MTVGSSHRRRLVDQIITHTRELARIPAAERRIDEWVGPAGNSDPDGSGSSSSGRHFYAPPDPDPARVLDDIAAIDRQLHTAAQALDLAARIIDRILRQPSPSDFEADVSTGWPGDACRWHRDVLGLYVASASRTGPTSVGGRLTSPAWMCDDCYARVRQTGKPPTRDDLEHHRKNLRWPSQRITSQRLKR